MTSATNALGQTTSYTYAGTDNLLTSTTNAQGDTTNYGYDSNGDLTSILAPDDTVQTLTYDAMGDPLSLTDPNGEATSYTYNALGEVTSVTLSDGETDDYTYDSQGNLITTTDPSGTTTLTYNAVGRADEDLVPERPGNYLHLQCHRPADADGRTVGLDRHRDGELHVQLARSAHGAHRRQW